MNRSVPNRTWSVLVVTAAICLTRVALGAAQGTPQPAAPAGPPQPPAEKVFKNIQVLKGVPVDEFLGSMGFISNALAVNCTYCHLGEGGGGWDEYAKDNPKKIMARTMMVMVNTINKTHFGGRQAITCFSCHRGADRPKPTPNLATLYGAPPPDDPRDVFPQAPAAPAATAVFDKYIAAVGGAARATALTSFLASGATMRRMSSIEARPPEAITGMETASASSKVEAQLIPVRMPSRSMSV